MNVIPAPGQQFLLVRHYLQTRLTQSTAAWVAGMGVTAAVLLALISDGCLTLLVRTIVPLGAAVAIGLSARSPFGEVEASAGSPLVRIRLGHLLGLVAMGTVALAAAAMVDPGTDALVIMVRNLAGYTGLALLAGALFGVSYAWLLPFAYGMVVFLTAMPDHTAGWWAWPIQTADHTGALIGAICFLAVGLAFASIRGTKDRIIESNA